MRIHVAVDQILYCLEPKNKLFGTLAQRGRDNKFNCPFGGCQFFFFTCRAVICQAEDPSRRQERGALNSEAKLQ